MKRCLYCGKRGPIGWETVVWNAETAADVSTGLRYGLQCVLRMPRSTGVLDLFVLGVPSYWQRFRGAASSAARERFLSAAGKVIMCGLVKRNGKIKAVPVPAHNQLSVMREIEAHTWEGVYYTDEWQTYATLKLRGEHVTIRKEKGRSVDRNHINGIEGFWSYAKNWLYPYRGVPRQYFHLYLAEICYRFNHRDQDLKPLWLKLLKTTSIQQIR
ncbi:IS1595 family transposase [uncultured Ferrovibrio sp.]|jgi:hypothetical protein|uniref:IS1595 family transposase n=1 Tax=uncultured Ferrovibrio sp. TaxID=1576913 RepID=UPI0026112365|nr:IS1595 family transposase [uncultured Ferrovibrio sp.]